MQFVMREIKNEGRGVRERERANRLVRRISQVKETILRSLFTHPISRAHPTRHSLLIFDEHCGPGSQC